MKLLTTTALVTIMATAAAAEGWKDDYQVLKFGILSGENEKDRLMRNEPLRAHIEETLGVKIEIFTAANNGGVIQAMAADQIEIARFGSSSYAAAYTATNGGVVPTLTDKALNGSTGYYSIVVTRCDSGIKNLEGAKGKVHAFGDPDSTSGYAVPYFNMLTKEGFKPEEYFGSVTFSGSHEASVTGVVNGTFDTAATYQEHDTDGVYQRMENKGMIAPGQVCKIWQSPEITFGPWTFRKNLPAELIEDVTTAIKGFPAADPEGYKHYTSWTADDPNPNDGFVRVDHDRYQWIVEMRAWIKKQRRSGS